MIDQTDPYFKGAFRRFTDKLKEVESGCWEWQSFCFPKGYGGFSYKGKTLYAHRFAYEVTTDTPIPDGMFVCHKCDNRKCCNPEHLFLGTVQDNFNDMVRKGRGGSTFISEAGTKATRIKDLKIGKVQKTNKVLSNKKLREMGYDVPDGRTLFSRIRENQKSKT